MNTRTALTPRVTDDHQKLSPLLVRALRGAPTERVPVWFMRQAGRSLPEYHRARGGRSLLEVVRHPEQVAEITLQPVHRHDVDAAILYSDIVVPLQAIGIDVEIRAGVGPVIDRPVRSRSDLSRIRTFAPDDDAPYVGEAVRLIRRELHQDKTLIGFAGAPFTLACYLVEGGPSKQQARTKALMLAEPVLFGELLDGLVDVIAASLSAQVSAGAQVVQVFDSWVGSLSRAQFTSHVQPALSRLMEKIDPLGVPCILFGVGTGHLLEDLAATGAHAIGVDWRTPLGDARRRLGDGVALQGNLDPATLLAGWDATEAAVRDVLADAPRQGYVFNLGHGVLPDTSPDVPGRIVNLVKELSS